MWIWTAIVDSSIAEKLLLFFLGGKKKIDLHLFFAALS